MSTTEHDGTTAGSPEAGRAEGLRDAAAAWCGEVVDCLRSQGRTQPADELQALLQQPAQPQVTVVVAGEDKRGKSSVVNSLIGRKLSPVGVETVTSAPIHFSYADALAATVTFSGGEEPASLDIDAAVALATLEGNPLNEHNVASVHVGVPAEVLEGMTLVDTPGVGGLDSGHAALTLQSLRTADALVFVLEAGAQIRGPELRFLRAAAARTARVVFALTKVDLYPGWRQIAEDNRAILAEHAARFAEAPMVPVSNQLATRAARLAATDAEAAAALRQESGVTALETVLRTLVTADVETLRAANMLQAGVTALMPLERTIDERLKALVSPADAQAALQAEKAKLAELRQDKAEWPQTLGIALRRLNLDRADRIQGGLADIRRRYEARLKELKREEHDQLPGEFVAELTAFAGETNHWTMERLVELVTQVVGDLGSHDSIVETIGALSADLLTEELAAAPISAKLKSTDKINVAMSYAAGHGMIGMFAFGTAMLNPLAIAAAVGVGSIMAVSRFRVATHQAFASEFRPWMNDQVSRVQLNMTNNFQRAQLDVEVAVRQLVKTALAERERQVNESIAACQVAAAQAAGERQRQAEPLGAALREVRGLRVRGRELLAEAAA